MNIEIWIENQRLDVSKDIATLLNLSIDDVANFAERSTSWSKTIVLPGTANNNKLFGHIFEIGHSNLYDPELPNIGYNFNAAKSADCIIFQDNLQTFKGVLRLLEIISENGTYEYECQAIGELAGLNVALSSGLLEDLDFSEHDHVYNHTNIIASWDNTPGSGYYYPLIDYGNYSTLKHDWDIKTFRPALYVKEFIDKMFEGANYRLSSPLFETDRFKRLVIPHSKKNYQQLGNPGINATFNGDIAVDATNFETPTFTTFAGNGFNDTHPNITYIATNPATISLSYNLTGQIRNPWNNAKRFYILVVVNSTTVASWEYRLNEYSVYDFNLSLSAAGVSITENDTITIVFKKSTTNIGSGFFNVQSTFQVASTDTALVGISAGDTIKLNYAIPSSIRQIDFLMSIVKMFNLYVYEDRFDSRLIHISPFVDFYTGEVVDWTYKLNRRKPIRIKPMSQLNAKVYEFKFKPDSDFYNDQYKKRYSEGYGDRIYDSQFEFTAAKKSFEVIFSASPLVSPQGEDKIFPSIQKRSGSDGEEERTDSNIRILQSKKITGVTSWDIKNGATILDSLTSYGYAGHLDDPDAPSNDLNFGAPRELFFTLATGNLSVNQFNVYWSPYMAEITDKDSKLLTGYFHLTPKDIAELDFSKYIFLDGNLFRLNSIADYNMSEASDCKVELLKVINSTYTSDTSLLYYEEGYVFDDYVE